MFHTYKDEARNHRPSSRRRRYSCRRCRGIGVLNVLSSLPIDRFNPKSVVGTSIGSLVGAI
ncbi:MAG: hypothetical protein WC763_05715 [Candidatus Paceibacterota bacterium]